MRRGARTHIIVGIAAGIVIRSGVTSATVVNNMISLGTGQTTNTAFIGIQGNHGSTPDPIDRIYFNTIQIGGTVASGAQPSFGFLRGDLATVRSQVVDIRNNLITNTRTGGSGVHLAIANNYGTTASATGWATNASNYNVLNAAGSAIGWWGSGLDFAGWKAASGSDAQSSSGISFTFVNAANDLHLSMGTTPTAIESGGVEITGWTTDFDGDARPGPAGSLNDGAFAPDIGADEFDGVSSCGDSVQNGPLEQCDDGNADNSDNCLSNCKLARCGDGVKHDGVEDCDTAGVSATCDADCTLPVCGDGVVNSAAGEACDWAHAVAAG